MSQSLRFDLASGRLKSNIAQKSLLHTRVFNVEYVQVNAVFASQFFYFGSERFMAQRQAVRSRLGGWRRNKCGRRLRATISRRGSGSGHVRKGNSEATAGLGIASGR